MFTPAESSFILTRALADKKLGPKDIARYQSDMKQEITDLEQRLSMLRDATSGGITMPIKRGPGRPKKSTGNGVTHDAAPATKIARRKQALTPEQRASRQLQGQYLGLIRQVPAAKRGKFSRVAKDKGREAAIKELRTFLA